MKTVFILDVRVNYRLNLLRLNPLRVESLGVLDLVFPILRLVHW
ncbi:MAG: hypothetical protein ACKO9Q_26410 [Pirellula sp.]